MQMVKKFDNMFTHFDKIHERDRRTDRRTRQYRPRLCIASGGKNADCLVIIASLAESLLLLCGTPSC